MNHAVKGLFDPQLAEASIPAMDFAPSPVDLFQMSATLGIAHRIHYDDPYTRLEEGHRALLVQGPLQAAYLLQTVLAWAGEGAVPRSFTFRHLAPAFVDERIVCSGQVRVVDVETRRVTCSVWAENDEGARLTAGEVVLEWPAEVNSGRLVDAASPEEPIQKQFAG